LQADEHITGGVLQAKRQRQVCTAAGQFMPESAFSKGRSRGLACRKMPKPETMANYERKFKMNTEIKKAVALTTAIRNKPQRESYRKSTLLSSLKEQIGCLLLYLQKPLGQNKQRKLWRLLESNLEQYYAGTSPHRILQNAEGEGFSGVESTNSEQRDIG
jgi:hypothetical protein